MRCCLSNVVCGLAIFVLAAEAPGGEASSAPVPTAAPGHERLVMTSLPPEASGREPPSQRALVDARAELKRRYRELLFRAKTSAGAEQAAETLLEAAIAEEDRALKWLLMAEARRLGSASGNAAVISRAITLASATYDFDALDMEYRALAEIPLRGISAMRSVRLAESAERLAMRAEVDGRIGLALSAQDLAIRAWQRAGAREATRLAMIRHAEIAAAGR